VRRLTQELGLSSQVVYTHFGSLGGLIDALYREAFIQLRRETRAENVPPGIDRVVAGCLAYHASAKAHPELYKVMFERPFSRYTPARESRKIAVGAFEPLVRSIEGTGRTRSEARSLALSVWAVMHGLVHLELQGYFPVGDNVDRRIEEAVRALLGPDVVGPKK
jgi:AcrR family transcriptional regulator